jgi:glycosyltransferase involved in cell wall biosynthesis
VYAYDQGYNALEAMAKGKVVFTGAEKEFEAHYKLAHRVAINAKPDVDYLVQQLSDLIDNPQQIKMISQQAREFILRAHHYKHIADTYLTTWEQH